MRIELMHFCYDESIVQKRKSVISVSPEADYEWWKEKHQDHQTYKTEK